MNKNKEVSQIKSIIIWKFDRIINSWLDLVIILILNILFILLINLEYSKFINLWKNNIPKSSLNKNLSASNFHCVLNKIL
jgi:hypothetical protein